MLFLATLSFASCDKDDEVNISQLEGTWSVANDDPNLSVDGFVHYSFNADKVCSIYSYDALSNRDTTIYRTYVLSVDNSLITLKKEDGFYSEQYYIRKLTSKEMKWENASPKDGNSDKRLVKVQK
ncbi:MAG: hypothetical protein ABFC28_01260 [Rikenellaceae bacterium]